VALAGRSVLRGVSVDLWPGEMLGLIGPNGAGKSTFLRAATGLIPIQTGTIAIKGHPLADFSRRELASAVAVVQQLPEAPATMRVGELVLLGRNPYLGLLGRESSRDYAAVDAAMRRAGCEHLAERPLGTLSGGQRRRAFIARALAQDPQLLLLDEPTANLDVQAQCEILELLRTLAADGAGVLIVMHDLTMAATYCDRLALLAEGRVLACGTPGEVVTAATVHEVYGERVTVIHRNERGAPIVVPAILEDGP
jgi:iron complex transport system ATP-binding protein